MRFLGLAAVVALCGALSSPALAGSDKLTYAAPDAWVQVADIPTPVTATEPLDSQLLLDDNQSNFTGPEDVFYHRRVVKIMRSEALARNGAPNLVWNPETQALTVHGLHIIRDGKVIDLLAGDKPFLVLRRETSLERAMLDGRLTATKQIEGLQVGDVIDIAWTVHQRDPVMQGKSEDIDQIAHSGVAGRVRFRDLWPAKAALHWRVTDGVDKPKLTTTGDTQEFLVDLTNVRMPQPPRDAPPRFRQLGLIEVTRFSSWAEISTLMAPLYRKAAELAPDSPIRAEAAKIKAASSDPKTQAGLALQLVEDQTRYLFLGMNEGGYVPAAADETWSRRFGDCKGKTVLLLALLNALGIDAQPALAHLGGADGLDERLQRVGAFNHVLVLAHIGPQDYLLDGTRTGDRRGLDVLPDFHLDWVLPLQDSGAVLRAVRVRPLGLPDTRTILTIDASAGQTKPATGTLVIAARGDTGAGLQASLGGSDRQQAERSLRESWAKTYPWLTITAMNWAYDAPSGVFTLTTSGTVDMFWRRNRDVGKLEYKSPFGGVHYQPMQKRTVGLELDAPFAVRFPSYSALAVNIVLPDHGKGYTAVGPEMNKTMVGEEIYRHTWVADGVAHMEGRNRSVAKEFKASEIDAANKFIQEDGDQDFVIRAPN
jgi:hypothetical protein